MLSRLNTLTLGLPACSNAKGSPTMIIVGLPFETIREPTQRKTAKAQLLGERREHEAEDQRERDARPQPGVRGELQPRAERERESDRKRRHDAAEDEPAQPRDEHRPAPAHLRPRAVAHQSPNEHGRDTECDDFIDAAAEALPVAPTPSRHKPGNADRAAKADGPEQHHHAERDRDALHVLTPRPPLPRTPPARVAAA